MSDVILLGKINLHLIENDFSEIQTDEIIITDERLRHIKERHPEDFELFWDFGTACVLDPDIILKDGKHEHTVFMIKKLTDTNLNTVVRVAINTDEKDIKNSVMTFYRIREKNLIKLMRKNTLLYKKE